MRSQTDDQKEQISQLSEMVQKFIQEERKLKGKVNLNLRQQFNSGCDRTYQGGDYYSCIGMVKALWRNKKTNQPQYMDYGTAFAVSPQIIMTCAHNIFHEEENRVADEIYFVPNHKAYILPHTKIYNSMKGQYYEFIRLKKGETLRQVPTLNQLCLIALREEVQSEKFIKIGICAPKPQEFVEIIGYPSRQYARMNNLLSVYLNRQHLRDVVDSIQGEIIHHELKTKVGHSGSPILYKVPNSDKMAAIGIHTHRKDVFINSGLFFTKQIIKKIKEFQENLKKKYYLSGQIEYLQAARLGSPNSYQNLQKTNTLKDEIYRDHGINKIVDKIEKYNQKQCGFQEFHNKMEMQIKYSYLKALKDFSNKSIRHRFNLKQMSIITTKFQNGQYQKTLSNEETQ